MTADEYTAGREELRDYMRGLIADHRANPRNDLTGHETTSNLISNFVITLLAHPNALATLRSGPFPHPGSGRGTAPVRPTVRRSAR